MYRICVVTAKIAFCFPVFVGALKHVIKDKDYKIIIMMLFSLVIIYTGYNFDGQNLKLTEITGTF